MPIARHWPWRARLATSAGDYDEAATQLEFCLDRWRDDPMVWNAQLELSVAAGRLKSARMALDHVPASQVDEAGIWNLKAWFARQNHAVDMERQALERLLTIEPGQSAAISRLAELLHESGATKEAAQLRSRKSQIAAARDRYERLYKGDRYLDHLEELATVAERLGRWFEARAFWELIRVGDPASTAATAARARLQGHGGAGIRPSGSLAQALVRELVSSTPDTSAGMTQTQAACGPTPRFEGDAAAAGLASFSLDNGMCEQHHLPEMACDGRLHFGLGESAAETSVEVRWPSGRHDRYDKLNCDAGYRLREGDPVPKPLFGKHH